VTQKKNTENEITADEAADAEREKLLQARKRGLFALGGTLVVCLLVVAYVRSCGDLLGARSCKSSSDCEGFLGVECLHAPTGGYCTHTCNRNEDCEPSFHCDVPPWEQGATRPLCLRDIPPAKK
jgi:hypothetical protein